MTVLVKSFARYVSSSIWGMLGLSLYILADTYFVSLCLGADGLAALNLAIPVYSVIHGTGLMLGIGGATRYLLIRGQGDQAGGSRVFTHACAAACAAALLFMSAGLLAADPITRLMGADGQVFAMTQTYLQVLLLFSPVYLANDVLLSFVRSDGAPRLAMAAMLAGSFANILLDYILMFPCRLGIFGAVLATGLAPLISLSVLARYFIRRRNRFHLCRCPFRLSLCRRLLSAGLPALITELSSGVVMIAFNWIILRLAGNTGVAAYGVVANLSLVVTAIFTGAAQGAQPLFSRHLSSPHALGSLLRLSLGTVLTLALSIYACFFLFAESLAGLFNHGRDEALQCMAAQGLRLYFSGSAFSGINILFSAYFPAVDRPLPAQILSCLRGFALIIPLALLAAALGGMPGLWLASPLTEGVTLIIALLFLRTGNPTAIPSPLSSIAKDTKEEER